MNITTKEIWKYENSVYTLYAGRLRIADYTKMAYKGGFPFSVVQYWDKNADIVSHWAIELEAKEECQRQLKLFVEALEGGDE